MQPTPQRAALGKGLKILPHTAVGEHREPLLILQHIANLWLHVRKLVIPKHASPWCTSIGVSFEVVRQWREYRSTSNNVKHSIFNVRCQYANSSLSLVYTSCLPCARALLSVRCPPKCIQAVFIDSIYPLYRCCKCLNLCPCPPIPRWAANQTSNVCRPSISPDSTNFSTTYSG